MFFKNKDIAVIGGGNSAIEEAIHLARIVNHVTLIHRRSEFTAEEKNIEELKKISNITIVYETKVLEFLETDGKFSGLKVMNTKIESVDNINVSGAFVYIGFEPEIDLLKNVNIVTDNGYIIVDNNCESNIPGIYACGDIVQKDTYQITTAIGEGSIAANSIIKTKR